MVKANGYGLGAAWVAGVLSDAGVREFFVATLEEGERLRRSLDAAVIYVLEGVRVGDDAVERLRHSNLVPVLNTAEQVQRWRSLGRPAAVHVDTGMQRLGLSYTDAQDLLTLPGLDCRLLLSHFPRSDEAAYTGSDEQVAAMRALADRLPGPVRLSLCNSAGLLRGLGPEALGRAGVALYGGNPFAGRDDPSGDDLVAVACLEAQVLQLRDVSPGTAVGYGGSFTTQRPTRVAVLGVGYADGLPRLVSNRGWVWAAGTRLPILGRVSMDMVQVDATDVTLAVGDLVEVLGAHVPLTTVADWAETIPYEVLTGLDAANRLAREEVR